MSTHREERVVATTDCPRCGALAGTPCAGVPRPHSERRRAWQGAREGHAPDLAVIGESRDGQGGLRLTALTLAGRGQLRRILREVEWVRLDADSVWVSDGAGIAGLLAEAGVDARELSSPGPPRPAIREVHAGLTRRAQYWAGRTAIVYHETDGRYTLERSGQPPLSLGQGHREAAPALAALYRQWQATRGDT